MESVTTWAPNSSDAAFSEPGGAVVVVKKLWLLQFAKEITARNLPPLKSFVAPVSGAVPEEGPQQPPQQQKLFGPVGAELPSSHPLGDSSSSGGEDSDEKEEGGGSSGAEDGSITVVQRGELEAALLRLPSRVATRFTSLGERTKHSTLEASAALDPHYVQQHVGNALQVGGGGRTGLDP